MRALMLAGLTAAAIFICTTESSASCVTRGGPFVVTSAGPWNFSLNVDKGRNCVGWYTAGGTTVFKQLIIMSPPRHGRLELRQGGRYSYKPNGGYEGSDSYILRVCGEDRGVRGCADLHYAVTVS